MKKINVVLLLLLITIQNLISQEITYTTSSPESITLKNDNLNLLVFGEKDIDEIDATFDIKIQNSIPFIKFNFNNKAYEYVFISSKNFAFIANKDYRSSILINTESVKWGVFSYVESFGFTTLKSMTASSTFKEEGEDYSIENTQKTSLKPWVEGVKGSGIGEKIFMEFETGDHLNSVKYLLFSNGYVSYKQPDLYSKNNRVKKIKIESIDKQFTKTFEIKDTPNIQELILPEATNNIVITILDVYKGTHWDDTCINYLVGIKYDEKLEELIQTSN